MSTNGAYPDEMREATLFTDALRAAVPARPSRELTATIVPRLAATARTATLETETQASRRPAGQPADRSRRGLVAKVAIAVALIPLLLAGLAFAGVTVPAPARNAFDTVGITLPNQPSDHGAAAETTKEKVQGTSQGGGGNEVSGAAQAKPKGKGGNSSAAHEHARKQHEKAQGKAEGHGQGKAVGLNGSPPPGHSGQTGPPAHSNAGGNGGGSSGSNSSGKPPNATHTPNGVGNGQSKTPPGQSK